jgi:DNA-binding NarL/FixJ family response regulator
MLRQVLSLKSIPGARSLNETITRGGPSLFQSALKRPEADTARTNTICLGLTARQRDVLAFMLQGKSNKAICRILNLAEPTVKNHVTAILKALKVTSRTEAVVKVSNAVVALSSFTSTISGYHAYRYGVWMANLDP